MTTTMPPDLAGPLQTEILCLMWDPAHKGKSWTVRAVHQLVNTKRDNRNERKLAYTTILTVMRNLARRSFVSQTKTPGSLAHTFTPRFARSEYEHHVLQSICTSLFGGFTDRLEQAVEDFRQYDEKHKVKV